MPQRPCLKCGALTASGSYCKGHAPSRVTPGRGGGHRQDVFRRTVLRAAGYRCEVIEDGVRCEVRGAKLLQAHHTRTVRELVAAGLDPHDAHNGRAVCRRHHEMIEGLDVPVARRVAAQVPSK